LRYTKKDLKHFVRLSKLFGEESFIDGEYPFYTDDRFMDEDNGTVTKNVYRKGKRTSERMFPVSTDIDVGKHMFDLHTIKYWKPSKHFNNSFINYVLNTYENLLTIRQKEFLVDFLNGEEKKYSKQLRYKYRTNIQRRLKKAFIGVGGDDVSLYMVAQYRSHIDLINKYIEISNDNKGFENLVIKKIDKEYVNDIVYCKLSRKARQNVIDFYLQKVDHLTITTLNEFFNFIMDDKERYESLGLI
jgi:hypothetical protein